MDFGNPLIAWRYHTETNMFERTHVFKVGKVILGILKTHLLGSTSWCMYTNAEMIKYIYRYTAG